jgi:hypothetical protein
VVRAEPAGAIFCGRKATLIEIRQALSNGAACELEGLPSAFAVSCPIALYPASSLSEKVSFHWINWKTGSRLKQQNVDSETSEVVSRDDMVRRYEVAKGQYPECGRKHLLKFAI